VAVINTSPDVVEMLRLVLQQAGFVVVTAMTHDIRDGVTDLETFVRQHEPRVVVYDIAPPYDANWMLFEHIRAMDVMQGRTFVITTTNTRHVEKLAGRDYRIYEVVGKPFDLDQVVQATREASRSRMVS
jgi:DNA-binding response OmpR family regulator